ncbi:MAG TPA: hypothetical protein VHX13_10010 [Acidobacteriaceae bacterium]|jgi:hypothetical protein|nr:hypothetical protein [Acidobacteriaceae bacterium]
MNTLKLLSRWFALGAVGALILVSSPPRAAAQDTTATTIQPGTPEIETSVRNAGVVYVEGSDLVLKLDNGKVEHMIVPESDVFNVDGRNVSVRDLKAGTLLTQTITTTTTPHYVNSVQTIKGKIWHVNAPNTVIVSLPDGKNHLFRVPGHAKFYVNGEPRTVHDLRRGMTFEATVVTDDMHTVVSQNKTTVGQAPPPPLPRLVGVLLFPRLPELTPDPTPVGTVTAEHAWARATLPQTASPLPMIGLFGLISLSLYLGLRLTRRTTTS